MRSSGSATSLLIHASRISLCSRGEHCPWTASTRGKPLTALEVSGLGDWGEALTALASCPYITELTFSAFPWDNLPVTEQPLPLIDELTVQAPLGGLGLEHLRSLFPGLAHLTLDESHDAGELNLEPLGKWPGLAVTITGRNAVTLIGTDPLGDRLTVDIH